MRRGVTAGVKYCEFINYSTVKEVTFARQEVCRAFRNPKEGTRVRGRALVSTARQSYAPRRKACTRLSLAARIIATALCQKHTRPYLRPLANG
ncbi:unnamed protein product, partial [Iphiclides podalirius]